MALTTQPYKGSRDFYPEDKRIQKYMWSNIRTAVERYGYEEYDTPVLEPTELYLLKGNQEIIDEQTYTFKDRGDRSVTMRTEMTPSVSRLVAGRRQELPYPLRWYSIPNLWRYERPQRGRLREFWQLNVDIFGLADLSAEVEIITVVDAIMRQFGATHDMYTIKLNSRRLMDFVLHEFLGFDAVQTTSLSRLIDRMHKIDRADFIVQADALCTPTQRGEGTVEKLLDVLDAKRFTSLPQALQDHPSVTALRSLIEQVKALGVSNIEFDVTLMRGFDYYTDIVFEVFDTDKDNSRSMFGGGRYDGLVALFGVEPVPTVGFGMGDVALLNFLETHELLPVLHPETDAYVIIVGEAAAATQSAIKQMRDSGLNLAVDTTGRKIGQQLKTAEKKGLNYVIIIGQEEIDTEQLIVKNLHTGEEEKHSIPRLVSIVKDRRTVDDD